MNRMLEASQVPIHEGHLYIPLEQNKSLQNLKLEIVSHQTKPIDNLPAQAFVLHSLNISYPFCEETGKWFRSCNVHTAPGVLLSDLLLPNTHGHAYRETVLFP